MKNRYLLLLSFLFPFVTAAQLYVNNFTGLSACPTNGNIPMVASNATGTPLSRTTITCSAATNVFNSTTLNNTAAIVDTSYIEFSLTAAPGFQLNLTSLGFLRQGSATAPNQLELRYSTDNFTTSTSWSAAPLTSTTGSVITWDFPDFSTAVGATIIFRFYPYGTQRCDLGATPASASGSFRLDDVSVNGSVSAPGDALIKTLAAWDFTGNNSASASFAATSFDSNLVSLNGASDLARGPGAAASAATNSFRTNGFKNDGISTSNNDYFQVTLTAKPGYHLSLSSIDANLNGTASFAASPGVTQQFAYSIDGINFILLGSPVVTIGQPSSMPTIGVTGISALQNVSAETTITFRYYASGQTATGGWGFFSSAPGINGLVFKGSIQSQTLAVNFADIKARQVAGGIQLQWSNMTESDVIHYDVEHSEDGRNFNTIASLAARSNNGDRVDYDFTDVHPLSKLNYYRIASLESTGNTKQSPVIKLDLDRTETSLILFPNPVHGNQFTYLINNLPKGQYTISLLNTTGQRLYSRSWNHAGGSMSELVKLPALQLGVYYIRLIGPEVLVARLMVE